MTGNTTGTEDESIASALRSQLWLCWVCPEVCRPVPVQHGLVIGRDPECEVSLSGAGLSRRHVEIYRQGPIFVLKDLGSRNGTFLNGKRVQHGPVSPGSVLRISDFVGVFLDWAGEPPVFGQIAEGLFGGAELQRDLEPLARAAKSDLSVVIVGSTGSGKERVARAVHTLSSRSGPFHAINCAALPKDLAEAELFGHRKGAFTGADSAGQGHFRAAHQGTLFLDEIADLPLVLQAKLLRVLEERQVMPVGDTRGVAIDVRVVAAAQRPLEELVAAREFREDLLARLSGLCVRLPTLQERPADIAVLFRHFIKYYSGGHPPSIDAKLIECLCLHGWPSNVRGLEQLARRLLVLHGSEPILKRSFLPVELQSLANEGADSLPPPAPQPVARREHDSQRLALALKQNGGNVAAAANLLGFSRFRAYRLLDGRDITEFIASELSSPS